MAALAETPDEHSEDFAPSQGSEIKSEALAVPDKVEDAAEDEDEQESREQLLGKQDADEDEEAVGDSGDAADPAASEEQAEPEAAAEPESEDTEPEKDFAVAGRRLGGRYRLERRVRGFGGGFEPEPQLWVGVDSGSAPPRVASTSRPRSFTWLVSVIITVAGLSAPCATSASCARTIASASSRTIAVALAGVNGPAASRSCSCSAPGTHSVTM